MSFGVRDSRVKSVGKAISWRVVGSIDTFVISLLITGSYVAAGSVASLETVSKVVLYYLHERAWSAVRFGRKGLPALAEEDVGVSIVPWQDGGHRADAVVHRCDTPAGAPSIASTPHTPPSRRTEDY
jgi:uncharacterized membrane protein